MKERQKVKDAYSTALRLLSIRARSVAELEERLRKYEFTAGESSPVIERLKKLGYLDDEKYALGLAQSRVRNKNWGTLRITKDLAARGISKDLIQKAISGLGEQSDRTAAAAALKKWLRSKASPRLGGDRKTFERAYRHLCARGFPPQVVMRLLKTYDIDIPEEDI